MTKQQTQTAFNVAGSLVETIMQNIKPKDVCETCNGYQTVYIPEWDSDAMTYVPTGSAPCPDCCGIPDIDPDEYRDNEEDR